MIEHLDKLIAAGIDSLKIEGRVKSQYYVATVVRSYRIAIDKYYNNEFDEPTAKRLLEEIKKVSYRDFTTGFLKKNLMKMINCTNHHLTLENTIL